MYLYVYSHCLSASARATALLGTFPEVGCENNLFQGLRTGLDIIFFHFSWRLLFWDTVFSKKKSSCFTLFEAKLIISYFLFYLNVLVLFIWQEDLKKLLSFDLTLDISLNDNWLKSWGIPNHQGLSYEHGTLVSLACTATNTGITGLWQQRFSLPQLMAQVCIFFTLGAHVGFSATTTFYV